MSRVLVLGSGGARERFAQHLEQLPGVETVDCDPELGDCVMYVRLEGARYDAFFFVGYDDPVTRGALSLVAERSVLIPLVETMIDPVHDGYLFRLPKAIGYRDEAEKDAVLSAVPKAAGVPSRVVGPDGADMAPLSDLQKIATEGRWQWDEFVEQVNRDIGGS